MEGGGTLYGYDSLSLAREGALMRALINVAAHVVLGLAAAWLGYVIVRA